MFPNIIKSEGAVQVLDLIGFKLWIGSEMRRKLEVGTVCRTTQIQFYQRQGEHRFHNTGGIDNCVIFTVEFQLHRIGADNDPMSVSQIVCSRVSSLVHTNNFFTVQVNVVGPVCQQGRDAQGRDAQDASRGLRYAMIIDRILRKEQGHRQVTKFIIC